MRRRLILLVVLALAGSASASPAANIIGFSPYAPPAGTAVNWPQSYYDAGHTSYNPNETILSPSTVSGLGVLWGQGGLYGATALALDKGVVYAQGGGPSVCCGGHQILAAFDATTGTPKWSVTISYVGYGNPTIAVGDGAVFTSCTWPPYNQGICSYKASTGKLLWQYSVGCSSAQPNCADSGTPVYAKGVVYYASSIAGCCHNDAVSAVDARTGQALWTYPTGDLGAMALAVGDGQVYFGCTGTNFAGICALSQSNGTLNWSYYTGDANNAVTYDKGVVYTHEWGASYVTYISALNALNGTLLWNMTYGSGNYVRQPVALARNVLYVAGTDGSIHAIRAKNGTQIWSTSSGTTSSVSVANGVLYVDGSRGWVEAYDAHKGVSLWSTPSGGATFPVPPIIANGKVYAANSSGCGDVCAYSLPALRTRGAPSRVIRR